MKQRQDDNHRRFQRFQRFQRHRHRRRRRQSPTPAIAQHLPMSPPSAAVAGLGRRLIYALVPHRPLFHQSRSFSCSPCRRNNGLEGVPLSTDFDVKTYLKTGHVHRTKAPSSLSARDRSPRYHRVMKLLAYRASIENEPGLGKRHWWSRGVPQDLHNRTVGNLENLLQMVAGEKMDLQGTLHVLNELIRVREVTPQSRHYRALVLANADAYLGSPTQVRQLFQEMEKNVIPIDYGTLHAALKVLAIHPDYIFRQEVLQMLRNQWLALSPAGWHNVVTGLIRECQYEMALETLSRMKSQNIDVPEWLLQLLIYNLCDCEEFDCVLDLMQDHVKQGGQFSPTLWYHVLDTASNALHEECSSYVWKQRVEIGLINPPRGVCNNILTITSRTGNTQLATSVFQFLLSGKQAITNEDYEALIDTYVMTGSIYSAFMILCMMTGTALNQENTATRSILSYLISTNEDSRTTWGTLRELSTKVKEAPISAVNVILELCVHKGQLDVALELYKDINTFIPKGPNTSTFNCLIHGSRKMNKLDYANFFVQEMIESKVLPDRATYEELVLLCAGRAQFEPAHNYLCEMRTSGFDLTRAGGTRLKSICSDSTDKYAKIIMADMDGVAKKPAERRRRRRSQSAQNKPKHQHMSLAA